MLLVPASTSSVIAFRSGSRCGSTFLLARRLHSQPETLDFLIVHFLDGVFRIIVVLKLLRKLMIFYDKTIGPLVLNTVDLTEGFEPFL